MKNLQLIETHFNTSGQAHNVDNYSNQGLHLVYFKESLKDFMEVILIYKDEKNNSQLCVLLRDSDLRKTQLIYSNSCQNPDLKDEIIESLKVESKSLLNENQNLRKAFFTIEEKLKNKNENLLPVLHSENSGISEAFVLNLVKMLTENKN